MRIMAIYRLSAPVITWLDDYSPLSSGTWTRSQQSVATGTGLSCLDFIGGWGGKTLLQVCCVNFDMSDVEITKKD